MTDDYFHQGGASASSSRPVDTHPISISVLRFLCICVSTEATLTLSIELLNHTSCNPANTTIRPPRAHFQLYPITQ